MQCKRCGQERTGAVSSMFDGEIICRDCHNREKSHPKYQLAFHSVKEAVNRGNYRYGGIGLPEDLQREHQDHDN